MIIHSIEDRNQGFSIVESLIAITVLLIVMVGGMLFFSQSKSLYYHGLHSQVATLLADSRMDEIKSAGCASTNADTGTIFTLDKINGKRVIGWPTSTTKPACTNSTNDIVVNITWAEPGESSNRTVSLETLVGP